MVYLKGPYGVIEQRLALRKGHFMSRQLLASQYAALEEPTEALEVDAGRRPPDIVQEIRKGLNV
jgi:gluconokinase